jgi:hypothetical protein
MALLSEEVETFLENTCSVEGRDLDVAIVYARSMVEALRASTAEWEAAAARLQEMKCRCIVSSN